MSKWVTEVLDDFLERGATAPLSVKTASAPSARSLRWALYKRRKTKPFQGELQIRAEDKTTVWIIPLSDPIILAKQQDP